MNIKRFAIVLVCDLLVTAAAQASYIANRDFLSVGEGSRADAMGEAYTAVADDASAMYWNPAGLTQLNSDEITFGFANRYDSLASDAQLHYARRGLKGMWGFGYVGSYIKNIPITQSLNDTDIQAISQGSFAPVDAPTKNVMDHALLFSYARPITPDSPHALGATVKAIYRDMLGMVHGYGTAIDLGYHYTAMNGTTRFGVNLQNAASLVSYTGTIDNLGVRATATESYIPLLRTGVAYQPTWKLLNGRLLLAFDVNMLTSMNVEDYDAGIEYAFGNVVALRAGKVFKRQNDSSQDYTLGMGLTLKNLVLDFSFLTNELGDTIRGTVGYRLGDEYNKPSGYNAR